MAVNEVIDLSSHFQALFNAKVATHFILGLLHASILQTVKCSHLLRVERLKKQREGGENPGRLEKKPFSSRGSSFTFMKAELDVPTQAFWAPTSIPTILAGKE